MINKLFLILDRFILVAGAFIFSQAPQFIQQYTQRLGGHVAEIQYHIHRLQEAALLVNKTLPEYINKFLQSSEIEFRTQGLLMEQMLNRSLDLKVALESLQNATVWNKPFVFVEYFYFDIAQGTWINFQPGLSYTLEGILYIILGMCIGQVLISILKLLLNHKYKYAKS